jgi:hypothetical protein
LEARRSHENKKTRSIQQIINDRINKWKVARIEWEKGGSSLEDMIAAVTNERHLWSYEYLHHLMRVIGTYHWKTWPCSNIRERSETNNNKD